MKHSHIRGDGDLFIVFILAMIVLILFVAAQQKEEQYDQLRPLLNSISKVESNHDDDAVGAHGELGRYQITRAYWHDATENNKKGKEWNDVKDPEYAEKVMIKYWERYCEHSLKNYDYEILARIHNGGPRGHTKEATLEYWRKVEKEMIEYNKRRNKHVLNN